MPELKFTPKDFEYHLLAVIGEKTQYRPGDAVPMADTFDEVCARIGVRAEDYGLAPGKNTLLVHRKIELAMRQLRGRGLTEYPRRGMWTLTDAGVQALQDESSSEATVLLSEEEKMPEVARLQTETSSEAQSSNVVKLQQISMRHPYSDDPYIRSLGAMRTNCFGAHSVRSEACKSCLLSTDCIALVGLRKAEIAAEILGELETEQRKRAEAAAAKAQKDSAVDEILNKMGDTPKNKAGKKNRVVLQPTQQFETVKTDKEGLCYHCREVIPENTAVIWVRDFGVLHIDCAQLPGKK